jgi:large subunit ribosomal protein L21e
MPHRRFQGKVGVIEHVGRRIVKVVVIFGSKPKYLQTKLNHIRPIFV